MHLQTSFLRDCFVTFWPRMIPLLRLVVIDTFHSYIVYCTVCCVYKVLQSWPGHLLLSVCAHVSWERMDFNGNTPSQGPLLQRTFTTCVCWKHVIIFLTIGGLLVVLHINTVGKINMKLRISRIRMQNDEQSIQLKRNILQNFQWVVTVFNINLPFL